MREMSEECGGREKRERRCPHATPHPAAPDAASDPDAKSAVEAFLYPPAEELPDDLTMPIWDHLDELRERILVAAAAATVSVAACFAYSKDLVVFLEAPVAEQGVRFLQLSPGEFFFTTLKVAGYAGLLLAVPTVLYEVVAYVVPGLTKSERRLLAPIVFGSGFLFYAGLVFSYEVLTPAALSFFVAYADGAVESLWSIDQYFQARGQGGEAVKGGDAAAAETLDRRSPRPLSLCSSSWRRPGSRSRCPSSRFCWARRAW